MRRVDLGTLPRHRPRHTDQRPRDRLYRSGIAWESVSTTSGDVVLLSSIPNRAATLVLSLDTRAVKRGWQVCDTNLSWDELPHILVSTNHAFAISASSHQQNLTTVTSMLLLVTQLFPRTGGRQLRGAPEHVKVHTKGDRPSPMTM